MDIMTTIAPFVANLWTILAVIIVLIVWAGVSGHGLHKGARRLRAELGRATGQITKADSATAFRTQYEAITEELGGNTVLGPRWREFQQTLWIPEAGLIRETDRSDAWFDLGLLRAKGIGIDPRYHAALPGLLVGAGLLFTFFGLAVALYSAGGIVAEGITQVERNAALHQLLSAASFKFWTSVAGLSLSILYTFLRKYELHTVELALEAFQSALDKRIPLITPVQMQAEANGHLSSQTTVLQSFSNDLAISMAGVFDNAFDKRLGEHIGPLTTAMQQLAESLTGRNEDAMEKMLGAC